MRPIMLRTQRISATHKSPSQQRVTRCQARNRSSQPCRRDRICDRGARNRTPEPVLVPGPIVCHVWKSNFRTRRSIMRCDCFFQTCPLTRTSQPTLPQRWQPPEQTTCQCPYLEPFYVRDASIMSSATRHDFDSCPCHGTHLSTRSRSRRKTRQPFFASLL